MPVQLLAWGRHSYHKQSRHGDPVGLVTQFPKQWSFMQPASPATHAEQLEDSWRSLWTHDVMQELPKKQPRMQPWTVDLNEPRSLRKVVKSVAPSHRPHDGSATVSGLVNASLPSPTLCTAPTHDRV